MESYLPQRKKMRLPDYDYSAEGYYYITICTKDKCCILSSIISDEQFSEPQVELSENGKLVGSALEYLGKNSGYVKVDKYVIMPNHVHIIIAVKSKNSYNLDKPQKFYHPNMTVPSFVSSLKRFTNKQSGQTLWQTNYYDHVIRNEKDYLHIWEYIDENPIKWMDDEYFKL